MVGKVSYESLAEAVRDSDGLAEALCEFVVLMSGEVVDGVLCNYSSQPWRHGVQHSSASCNSQIASEGLG